MIPAAAICPVTRDAPPDLVGEALVPVFVPEAVLIVDRPVVPIVGELLLEPV